MFIICKSNYFNWGFSTKVTGAVLPKQNIWELSELKPLKHLGSFEITHTVPLTVKRNDQMGAKHPKFVIYLLIID